jgi:hypothetical protein
MLREIGGELSTSICEFRYISDGLHARARKGLAGRWGGRTGLVQNNSGLPKDLASLYLKVTPRWSLAISRWLEMATRWV